MRAARYLGISIFDLMERSVIWRTRALMAQNAENWAETERAKIRGSHRGKSPRGG